jgi:mediator of RNA polymerase II transcription subunit 10
LLLKPANIILWEKNNENSNSITVSLSTLSSHTLTDPASAPAEKQTNTSASTSSDPAIHTIQLPPEIIDYVDASRNPDIYTREFVELVQRGNQDLKGKADAFAGFRDVLAKEMISAMPECKREVERVLKATGGGGGAGLEAEAGIR